MSIFGDYFKYLRVNVANKTIRDICKDSNIDLEFLYKIERGVIVPNDIVDLCQLFGGKLQENEYNTLLELSKIKDIVSFDDFSITEQRRLVQENYRKAIIDGKPLSWYESEKKTRGEWGK